jgi:hypothetical protein
MNREPNLKKWPEDKQKMKELVLYISQKCADDPGFGATKLNKILYFSDFLAYAYYGHPITAFEYQKLPYGPAPRRLLPVCEEMMQAKELGIQEMPLRNGYVQRRTVNLRLPDLEVFTAKQIALVDAVIEALAKADARTVSTWSHMMLGWALTEMNETIPYETIFLTEEPLNEIDILRGLEVAKESDLLEPADHPAGTEV